MEDSRPTKRRLWIPCFLLFAYGALYGWTVQSETMLGPYLVLFGGILFTLLTWLWFTFLSGIRPLLRWTSFTIGIGLIAFLYASLRFDGSSSGTGLPRFVWKWAPTVREQSQQTLANAPSTPQAADAESDESTLKYRAVDSSQYLGPNGNGVFPDLNVDVGALGDSLEAIWRQPIGLGWAGFATKGRLAITQEQRGEEEWVSAYDIESGALRWKYAKQRRFSESMGGDGPRATPTIVDETVYALGATGILDALNVTDGTPIWSYNALAQGGSNLTWGKSASPLHLAEEELIVVTGGGQGGPTVQAVNTQYGESAWTWGTEPASYATPIVATIHDERQLVIVNENTVVGLRPSSGELLWSFDWPVGMMPSTPKVGQPTVIDGSKILITASYGIGSILLEIKKEDDETLSTSVIWHAKNRMKTKFSSACVLGEHAYGLDEGRLACIELESGKRLWKDGKYGYGQNILVGNTLIVQAEDGDVAFVEATPERFNEWVRVPGITGKTWNVPTLAGEYLLIRNDQEAACYRVPTVSSTP